MVIFHSYVSLPEGKSGLSFLRCQWEGQGLTIGDFFASWSVSTAMWCSYTKSTLAIAHPRALWFCSPTFQKSRGLWLTKHASLANKTYKTAALCTPPGQNDTAWSRLQLCFPGRRRRGSTGGLWDGAWDLEDLAFFRWSEAYPLQLWPFTSYNWWFLWDYTFYKWGYKYL